MLLIQAFDAANGTSCRGSCCSSTRFRQNSQPAVDLIQRAPGELVLWQEYWSWMTMRRSRPPSACCWSAPAIAWSPPATGRKGLALFEAGDFDLLFLDIFMPGMDGFETMRMVRQQRPQIPIIVISGRPISSEADTAPDFLTMATKLGAISSLQKPFRPADLLAAVTGCLEAARRVSSPPTDRRRCCFLPVMRHSIRSGPAACRAEREGVRTPDMTLTTRLAIAMIALVAIAVSAVGWLSYRNLEQALLPRARDRIETHSRQVATDLEYYAASATGDVAGFRSAAALHGLIRARRAGGIDPVDGVSEKTWRDRLASRLAAELEAKPAYAMFRIIGLDDDGRELVRVDRAGPNETVRIVPEEELQREKRSRLFPGNDPAGPRTNLRLAARSGSPQRTDRGGAQADASRRDADLRRRRQAVRHFHDQCRHAARVRPRPVIGVAGRDDLRRQPAGRLSHSPRSFARIRLVARQAERLESRLPASGVAGWSNARQSRTSCRIRPPGPAG
mgnify:CR=1 FL=1